MNDGDRVSTSPFSPLFLSPSLHSLIHRSLAVESGGAGGGMGVRRSADDLSSPLPPTDENLGSERIEEQKREGFGDLGEEFAPFPPC